MAQHIPTIATALIPFTSVTSLSVYLASHPDSPARRLFAANVALPTSRDEALDGSFEKDAFDLYDHATLGDGQAVEPERFWKSTRRQKIALFSTLLVAFAANIALLVLTIIERPGSQPFDPVLPPALLVPSHLITILLAAFFLSQTSTSSHWPTTIHLSTGIFVQFIVLGIIALLPHDPFPSSPSRLLNVHSNLEPIQLLRSLLPILHLVPLTIILFVRRGPPLYIPLDRIYPPQIIEAVPTDHPSLDPTKPNVCEEVEATVPEWLLFGFVTNVVKKGYLASSMDVWDLPVLVQDMRALSCYRAFKNVYGRHTRRLANDKGYHLLKKLAQANAGPLTTQLILTVITAVLYYLPHYLLQQLLLYLERDPTRERPAWGWLISFALFASNAGVYIISGIIWSISTTTLQARIKLQLQTLLFSKTLRKKDVAASSAEQEEDKEDDEDVASKAQIMTLFTVDVERVSDFVFHAFAFVDSPIEIAVATVYLFQLLGRSAIYGLLAALLCLPLNHLASKVVVTAQENLMKSRDQRTALMNEILQGIRMLKFMAWERKTEERIAEIRNRELFWQARNYTIEVVFNVIWAITPVIVTVISFLHFTLVAGHTLTPAVAFTSVAVFGELRYALNALPETFINALQGFVSVKRIQKYLNSSEVDPVPATHASDITLTNATFTWPRDESALSGAATPKNTFTLANMTLRFPRNELSLVCGRLGSGKSLLLLGLLGEADLLVGSVSCPRSQPDEMASFPHAVSDEDWLIPTLVAYVPQQAWLTNASIKNNILYSSPWNEDRYRRVLQACSLVSDLAIFEDGDETEIGEKGLNLSGGQKARVSLARAVYSRAGILLMDDVLSAVDAHTAQAILENCFQGEILKDRTVVLVSHHTALISPIANYIVALENGDVKFSGTRAEFVEGGLMDELDDEKGPTSPIAEKTVEAAMKPIVNRAIVDLGNTPEIDSETSSLAPDDLVAEVKVKPPRKLVEDEKRATGRIGRDVWATYFKSLGGPIWWMLFALGQIVAMLIPVAEKLWLQFWTGAKPKGETHSSTYYVVGYALITLGGAFLSNVVYVIMYFGSIRASRKLHSSMLQSVLFAKLRFHDTTNTGRIINRFGKDVEGLDSSMADNFTRSLQYGLSVAVTFVSIMSVGGLPFLIAGCLMLIIYYQAGKVYGQTSRDMRRLDSVTRSPLYALFGETVTGLAVIRAFGSSTIALKRMIQLADVNTLTFYWNWSVNRWISARFNVLSSVMIGITAVIVLNSPRVDAAMAGFALAFASGVSHDLLFVVRRFVQLEQSMVALERIKEYSELPLEAPEFVEPRPSTAWPERGVISVEKLVVRYSPELPNVLHGISFDVQEGEKIGVVGATGCGKSTLALSFFRFVEAHEGRIVIDGLDISKIGLTDLRSRVTIIPQDPTILSGTIRSSLDVFGEYEDADIFAALRRVHLITDDEDPDDEDRNKNVFRDLDNPVNESGDNFSAGEKQLICMARAILRRNKILFMDEATASIDYQTDELISKTIREEFQSSTIVTIAHRISTIIDFDKVLVMERGQVAEFASPAELLRSPKSRFYHLCKATGRAEFRNLREMAVEAEKKRASV